MLVVEDTPTSRELLEMLLKSWSIPVTAVATAEEGVALLEQRNARNSPNPIGAVVLDLMLPGMSGLDAAERIRARAETRSLPIILISAYAGKEEEARCAEIGVNVFLPKPITASSLFDALVTAEGAQVHTRRRELDVALEREFDGARALLAEDNEANQMVAKELLQRLGIEIDIAENGRRAVEMLRDNRGRYAAVLMDMQMPEMDGIEATRVIRADASFQNLPIIAMTANAMKQDLDACIAAGMNDVVTKPVDRRSLVSVLRKWLLPRQRVNSVKEAPESSRSSATPVSIPDLPGINVSGALDRLGLGFDTFCGILVRFAEGQAKTLDELRLAIASADARGAARHAHALAGAAGNLGADALRMAAKTLEQAARDGRVELAELLQTVESRAAEVFKSIATLREARPSRAVAAPVGQPQHLRERLGEVAAAIEQTDPAACETALSALDGLQHSPLIAAQLQRVRTLVEEYDYEEAGRALSELLEQLSREEQA